MKPADIESLISRINTLDIDDSDKSDVIQKIKSLKKFLSIADFKIKRVEKDKFITTNLLRTSVDELEKNQAIVEEANRKLSEQKAELEAKNIELRKQKVALERQSRQVIAHLKELERSNDEMEQFTYIASHDLQSPLRTITNFATLLKERYHGQLDQRADEFIHFMTKGTTQMKNVINDLLDFSRASRKDHQFEFTKLDEVIEMVRLNLHQAIEKNDAKITTDSLPELYIYKSGILQLFQNLLSNAIKFRADHRPIIKITCDKNEKEWIFKVIDNGLGMDEAFQKKAFLPFQRVNHLDRPGTGIGLAICKKVVKLHGGEIYFKSKINEGTTFVFTIPLQGANTEKNSSKTILQKDLSEI